MPDWIAELEFACELADLASSISLPAFVDGRFLVVTKPDGSPVTDIDRAVEDAVRQHITRRYPDHMVIGEEAGAAGDSEWCWYVDPIDGTTRYVSGDPKWMTLIALGYHDEIVVGFVDRPATGQRWWASRGRGAFYDGQPISVSDTACLADAVICDDWREHIAAGDREHPLTRVAARCGHVRSHQGHASLAVACGQADVAISTGGYPWDYAPLKVIVEEAGGKHTDFDGGPRIDTRQVVISNGQIHDAVLQALHE